MLISLYWPYAKIKSATYTAVFSEIRKLFADTQISKQRGYSIGRFSFNVIGGRCEECKEVEKNIEMNFLPVYSYYVMHVTGEDIIKRH